jgi:hypothetical protein
VEKAEEWTKATSLDKFIDINKSMCLGDSKSKVNLTIKKITEYSSRLRSKIYNSVNKRQTCRRTCILGTLCMEELTSTKTEKGKQEGGHNHSCIV